MRWGCLVAVVCLLIGSRVAPAQETPDDELADEFVFLEEEEVVLTAAKHKQKAGFSPAAVEVVTRQDIEESGATNLMELLRRYSAVLVYVFDPLYPSADARGTIRILLLIDGREINVEFFTAPFYAILPIGLTDIERIEIVLGPNSALYGANAVAAVINIVTRSPSPELYADLSVAGGGHGTFLLEGLVSGGTGPAAFQGSFGIDRANSWMDRSLTAKDLMRTNLTMRLDLPGGHLTANGGLVNGDGRIFGVMGYMNFPKILFAHAQANLEIGKLKARAHWYGIWTDIGLEVDLVHPSTGLNLGSVPMIPLVGDTVLVEGQYQLNLFEGNLLIAGADFRYSGYRSEQIVGGEMIEYRLGGFLHDEQRFGERLLLTLGARFDWNSVTEPAISPRIALVYNPAGEHFLRLSAATAFRKPNLLETSANFKVDTTFPEVKTLFEDERYGISNPNLDNEILSAVEVGYRGALLDKALRFGADAYFGVNRKWIGFRTDVKFNQMMQIDLDNSEFGYDNFGDDTDIVGINMEVEGEPWENLTLFLRAECRYEWEVESGRESTQTINLHGAAGFVLRLPLGLTAHLAVAHAGERTDNIRNSVSILGPSMWLDQPAHTYLLGAFRYQIHLGRSRLDLGLSLFNPFGGRFREKVGLITRDGSNFGGELIGTRTMLTARFRY